MYLLLLGNSGVQAGHTLVGVNLETGEERTLVGSKEIRDAGFNPAAVYTVAKKMGRNKHHNHTFELVAH